METKKMFCFVYKLLVILELLFFPNYFCRSCNSLLLRRVPSQDLFQSFLSFQNEAAYHLLPNPQFPAEQCTQCEINRSAGIPN